MGAEKLLVAWSCAFLFATFAITGVFMETTVAMTQYGGERSFSGDVPVEVKQIAEQSSDATQLRAMIKGSIYETGSNMTVFGACFDGNGYLLPEADATFTAWYPNGTLHTGPNQTMGAIYDDYDGYHPNGTGRWKVHVTMGSTIGTYLTEIRCEYDGEWAVAFGEWQNPEWVQRISATQDLLVNVSLSLEEFRNDTNENFSQVLDAIGGITVGVGGDMSLVQDQVRELRDMVRAQDVNFWTIDGKNPFYILGSGEHQWVAVDMLSPKSAAVVSTDGWYGMWDGETWVEENVSGVEFRGVSVISGNAVYSWGVGGQNGTPVYSINGGNATPFNLSGGGAPTVMNDIKLFLAPNDPTAEFYGYAVGNDGSVYMSVDSGLSWGYIGAVDAANKGRISQVVENYDVYSQVNGYMVMVGQGAQVLLHDGNTSTNLSISGDVADVDLLYYDLGYVVVEGTGTTDIYKYNGTALVLDYQIDDATIFPTGVKANAQHDVWVTTSDPSTFYHFDGRRWEYSTVGFSQYVSIIIQFDGNGSNTSAIGVTDVAMSDSDHGYAVGGDGLILIYKAHYDERFDLLLENMTAQFEGINLTAAATNLTPILDAIADLTNITLSMNQSVHAEIDDLSLFLQSMNASLQYKIDNVLSNVTYTNLYLTSTIYPLLDDVYQNTVDILIQLGILEGKINQTILLQNQTLGIVNETSQDVDWLVQEANRTRVRAWITQ